MKAKKMQIEIWSDVACPFCYIGQEHLRQALASFSDRDYVEITWKSFILDPTLPEKTELNLYESLSKSKGMPLSQVMDMTAHVRNMGREAGLTLDFDRVVPVSTIKAHLLLQMAKQHGIGKAVKDLLFKAYFTEGASLTDIETLKAIGLRGGLNEAQIDQAMNTDTMKALLEQDLNESRQLGIRGVPYFLLNEKYAVSGAQPVKSLLSTIEKAYAEWLSDLPDSEKVYLEGAVCKPAGKCD